MPSACFKCGDMQIAIETIMDCHRNMPKACPYVVPPSLPQKDTKGSRIGASLCRIILCVVIIGESG